MASSDLQNQPGNGFPGRAAGSIAIAVGILIGAHYYGDHSKGWDPSTFLRAWIYKIPHRPKPLEPSLPSTIPNTRHVPGQPDAISPFLVDDHFVLDPFFEGLWQLEKQKKYPQPNPATTVTIVHYGDSPTTADLITGDIRAYLQERFGNAGEGFNLTAKPWAWYGHRHVEISDGNWSSSQEDATGVGRYKRGDYGLGGAIFSGKSGAHTTYTLTGETQTSITVHYLAYPGGGSFLVSTDSSELGVVDTNATEKAVATRQFVLPPGTTKVSIRVVGGTVKQYGVDFRTGKSGVLYDSLGLNGATTTVLSRTLDPQLLAESLHAVQPQLIVINYGTNESQFSGLVSTLEKELTMAIARLRTAAPGVPILIMSPMDRGQRNDGEITTKAEIPQIVSIQKKVAAEQGCAFFDTYEAMGGEGTVARWYDADPRLMTADLIHPTPRGALLVATLLEKSLYAGYDRWKRTHGIVVSPVALRPEPSSSKPHLAPAPRTRKKPIVPPPSSPTSEDAPAFIEKPIVKPDTTSGPLEESGAQLPNALSNPKQKPQ